MGKQRRGMCTLSKGTQQQTKLARSTLQAWSSTWCIRVKLWAYVLHKLPKLCDYMHDSQVRSIPKQPGVPAGIWRNKQYMVHQFGALT
jgi:hypothetical protein